MAAVGTWLRVVPVDREHRFRWGVSTGVVNTYLSRARRAELRWLLPEGVDDEQLERLLYPPPLTPAEQKKPPRRREWKFDRPPGPPDYHYRR